MIMIPHLEREVIFLQIIRTEGNFFAGLLFGNIGEDGQLEDRDLFDAVVILFIECYVYVDSDCFSCF